jgi:ketosteroid isomerase-like protein
LSATLRPAAGSGKERIGEGLEGYFAWPDEPDTGSSLSIAAKPAIFVAPLAEEQMPDVTTAHSGDIATPELMKQISAAFNSRDVDRIASFFTEDATFWLARGPEPVGRTLKGRETIRKTLAARFKVIPDMRWDHKEYIYAGNRAISVWTVVGKSADGEALNYQGCDIYTFRGGKICAKDTYWKIVEQKDRL